MDKSNAQVSLPEKVVLNGVEFLVKDSPELQQFMQEVSKVEKNKIYSQVENLKAQIAKLGNVQIVNPQQQVVEPQAPMGITQESLEKLIKDTVAASIQPLMLNDEARQKMALEEYRQKLVNENSANCIPELITGNTKEELDKALAKSIELRAKYVPQQQAPQATPQESQAEQQQVAPQATPQPQAAPTPQVPNVPQMPFVPQGGPQVPVIPQVPNVPSPEPNGTPDIKSMTLKEFGDKREALLAQIQSLVK